MYDQKYISTEKKLNEKIQSHDWKIEKLYVCSKTILLDKLPSISIFGRVFFLISNNISDRK